MKKFLLVALFFSLFAVIFASSVPMIITFQGRLSENGSPVNGTKNMHFEIVNGSGTARWQSDPSYSNRVPVSVSNGIYTVNLGDSNLGNMADLNQADIDLSEILYVRVRVEGEQLSPDILLSSTPFSYITKQAETLTGNATAGNSVAAALENATDAVTLNVDLNIKGVNVVSANDTLTFEY
jgi:hypothetical protein